ncbi:sulfotransferase family protein [Novosphingobium sp. ZW T3_23]|uniref:sulfotransferase family protein n=1 Tax=Novosphingobium sp. ZW T3_23 TaxID=3378084 RepID=UPI0038523907
MDTSYDPPSAFRHAGDALHELVAAEIGSSDFGPDDYLPGLDAYLHAMDYDPRFHEQGRRAAWGQIIGVLRGRAHAYLSMKRNPGFDRHPVVSPVVITGVPRTGTTALHRLMALDQRFQGLQTWLLDAPMPRPPIDTWTDYPQFRKTMAGIEAQHAAVPGHQAAHFRAAEEVHECCMVLWHGFTSNILACSGPSAQTYDAWWRSQSEAASYDHFRACVQLIGSNEPDKRWLLKNPGHIENLDLLFAVFPDAKVIQTHRDPGKAIPSLVSLMKNLHPLFEEGRLQERSENMLIREVAKWSEAVEKAERVRARHPGQVLDVVHADFHADPMAVLERIYAFIDMDIPDALIPGFEQRIAEKPELSRGAHRYDIADFGMTADQAREPFRAYIDRYDLLEKSR